MNQETRLKGQTYEDKINRAVALKAAAQLNCFVPFENAVTRAETCIKTAKVFEAYLAGLV